MRFGQETVLSAGKRACGIVAVVVAALPLQAGAHASDCPPPQRALFSCDMGTKAVSVCGSPDLTADSGFLQYRFGRLAALELSYPPAGTDWRKVTHGGTLMFSGGGGAFLAFTNAPFRYVVYSATGRGWGSKAGVVVEKNGRKIASLACKGKVKSELGPELFSAAGIETADDSFVLP